MPLSGDEYFANLFKRSSLRRLTVPARVVATVMLLQAYEGLSDREACHRLAFDLGWKAAAVLTGGRSGASPHGAGGDGQPAAADVDGRPRRGSGRGWGVSRRSGEWLGIG